MSEACGRTHSQGLLVSRRSTWHLLENADGNCLQADVCSALVVLSSAVPRCPCRPQCSRRMAFAPLWRPAISRTCCRSGCLGTARDGRVWPGQGGNFWLLGPCGCCMFCGGACILNMHSHTSWSPFVSVGCRVSFELRSQPPRAIRLTVFSPPAPPEASAIIVKS